MEYERTAIKTHKIPMIIGIIPLFIMFWLGFIIWWSLMYNLFFEGKSIEGLAIGYILPSAYSVVAYIASRNAGHITHIAHFITFAIVSLVYAAIMVSLGYSIPAHDAGPFLGTAFIAAVMSLMQYPMAGLQYYFKYRTPLFIAGVIFMPLFIYFASMLPSIYQRYLGPLLAQGLEPHHAAHEARHMQALEVFSLFPIGMIGFWASAAWLASRRTQGVYVPGLEIKPFMPFRPDLILPGGVLFVKGVILMGVGLIIAIHAIPKMPIWNWWGFALAFWGIITLIPLRGMYKMVRGRRRRMLGDVGAFGYRALFFRELMLFIGLLILLYGFLNAFTGNTPFTVIGVSPEWNAFVQNQPAGWLGVGALVLAFLLLVIVRGWYKTRLPEGAEKTSQLFLKQLLLWLGTLSLIVSYVHLFWIPAIRPDEENPYGFMVFFPDKNPIGFSIGITLFIAGTILILILRPIALRNEFAKTLSIFVGMLADAPEELRYSIMKMRVAVLARLPFEQRVKHVKGMIDGLNSLPDEKRDRVMKTQLLVISELSPDDRSAMLKSMDQALFFAT
jgi:hypothetical protein